MMSESVKRLLGIADELRKGVSKLKFRTPVAWVYNPLDYAWLSYQAYVSRYAPASCRVLFLGMNPGPFGMAQTGVPFGEIAAVRDWLEIEEKVAKPPKEHPKRPIEGFDCKKSEVSGKRLWGLFALRYGNPSRFFREHFVINYCPLVFMDESARNVTPDKLHREDAAALHALCDRHLVQTMEVLKPRHAVGVGAFAEVCFQRTLGANSEIAVSKILHPSPASPAANRNWAGTATEQLKIAGVWTD
jgi:single-strand selective monofunctional uracil DNA glycosylase